MHNYVVVAKCHSYLVTGVFLVAAYMFYLGAASSLVVVTGELSFRDSCCLWLLLAISRSTPAFHTPLTQTGDERNAHIVTEHQRAATFVVVVAPSNASQLVAPYPQQPSQTSTHALAK